VLTLLLTLALHAYVVQRYQALPHESVILTPPNKPKLVEIILTPPPKPIVQPPPPPPPPPPKKKVEPPPKKLAPTLKPVKPSPKPAPPKVAPRVADPTPAPATPAVEDEAAPAATVRTAPPSDAPPAPPVEKVTPPSASAGYLHNPAPSYPAQAEEEGWEGRVLLKVHVMANGRPDSVSVQKSSGYEVLDHAAVNIVKSSWHFVPAKRGDTPIDGWVTVPIAFNLPS
jgi:protein TonB